MPRCIWIFLYIKCVLVSKKKIINCWYDPELSLSPQKAELHKSVDTSKHVLQKGACKVHSKHRHWCCQNQHPAQTHFLKKNVHSVYFIRVSAIFSTVLWVLRNLVSPSLYLVVKQMPSDSFLLSLPHPCNQNPLKSFFDLVFSCVHLMHFDLQFPSLLTDVPEQCSWNKFRTYAYSFGSSIIPRLPCYFTQNTNCTNENVNSQTAQR